MSARRDWLLRVVCSHPECREGATYRFDTKRDLNESHTLKTRATWKCVRHTDPERVLSTSNAQTVYAETSSRGPAGRLYWGGRSGFVYGPGFKAWADDFPEGARIVITARVEFGLQGAASELANAPPATLEEAYAEGRSDEREEVRKMLREEAAGAKRQARENGGNPRYDYYADAIEMILGNLD
jgi:hypothetical protein